MMGSLTQEIYYHVVGGVCISRRFACNFGEFVAFFETFHNEGTDIIDSIRATFIKCEVGW